MIFNAIRALILMLINQNWGVQHVQFWNVGLKIKITIRRKMHWKKYCCCCCNGSETRYEGLPSYFSPISDQWHKVPKVLNNQNQNQKQIDGQQLTNIYGQTTKNWYKTMSWSIQPDTNSWQQAFTRRKYMKDSSRTFYFLTQRRQPPTLVISIKH